jgi:hypothetical protein
VAKGVDNFGVLNRHAPNPDKAAEPVQPATDCRGGGDLPNASSACIPRFTTPSIFNGTSFSDPHCGSSEQKLTHSGTALSQPHEELRVLALNACSIELP